MAIFLKDSKTGTETAHAPSAPEEAGEGRRRRDPEATRRAILDAAEDLFVVRGPDATSLAEIASAAGVNKSLIHHHFGSKEALWSEVQGRHFHQYYEAQHEMLASAPSAEGLLRDSMIAFFRFLQTEPKAVRFLSWTFCAAEPCKTEQEKALFELGIARIRDSQAKGEIRTDVEPLFVIKSFLALAVNWFQTRELTHSMIDSPIAPNELDDLYLDTAVKILLDGVRPR
jgi:TetR/AcrR family transcriptional regulator